MTQYNVDLQSLAQRFGNTKWDSVKSSNACHKFIGGSPVLSSRLTEVKQKHLYEFNRTAHGGQLHGGTGLLFLSLLPLGLGSQLECPVGW